MSPLTGILLVNATFNHERYPVNSVKEDQNKKRVLTKFFSHIQRKWVHSREWKPGEKTFVKSYLRESTHYKGVETQRRQFMQDISTNGTLNINT